MAGLKKDVELIFRGVDRASPTIKGVRDNVRDLTKAVADQVAAAERGEGSIDDLVKVYKRLKDAQGDVTEITKLAAAYDSLSNKYAEQSAKADDLRQKEAALNAEIASAEAPAKRLINSRDAATRKADAAAAKELELATAVKLAGEAFEQAGGDLRNFEASQESIRTAALETARGLNTAATALDNYNLSAAEGARHQRTLAEASRFAAMAAESGLPQAQINYISAMENRVEMLTLAMKENAASAARMKAAQTGITDAADAQRIRDKAAAYEEAAAAADRLRLATEFKSQAASIEATARDVQRFGTVSNGAAASATRLADTIQMITAPAQGASRTLDGLNSVVMQSEALLDGSKRRMSEYNASLNDLAAAQAGAGQMATMIDGFRQQEAAASNATGEFNRLQAETLELAGAIQRSDAPTQEMVNNLSRLEANLTKAGGAMNRENIKLVQMQRQLEAAGIDVRQLAMAEEQLINTTNRLATVQGKLRGVGQGKGGFMGLNPNELTNLGYQVNDVVVSLVSGQNPLMVFVQQGSQIGQIWPGALSKIAARLPVIAAILAVLVPLGAALGEVAEDSRRLNEATANLESMGAASSSLSTAELAAYSEKLEEIGLKADEAAKAVRDLMADGLNDAQMLQYIETAKAAAQVTGVDFKEALDLMRESFQGGMDDIYALQEATGVYDAQTLALIETLFEQGRADEARATALAAYQDRMNDASASARGPWKVAIENLGLAWNNFVNWLANTAPIRAAASAVAALGRVSAYWAARLAGKDVKTAMAEAQGINVKETKVNVGDAGRTTPAGRKAIAEQEENLRSVQAVTAAQKRMIEGRKEYNKAIAAGAAPREAEKAGALAIRAFDIEEGRRQDKANTAAGKKADAAGRRAAAQRAREARAAETAARKIASTKEQLTRQLESLDAAVGNKQEDDLERRLEAIDSKYEKLFRDIDEYSKATGGKGEIDGVGLDAARARAQAQLAELKNYETLEFREKQLQNLLSERAEKLDAIDDKVARGIISPEEGLAEAEAVINDIASKVAAMATSSIAFAEALRGTVPGPQLEAFLAKMQSALQNNSGGQNVRAIQDRRKETINVAEQGLNDIISARNALIATENTLVEMGLQSRKQAESNTAAAFAESKTAILEQIELIRRLAASYGTNLTPEMKLYFQNLEANLKLAAVQTDYTSESLTNLRGKINEILTSNIVTFIDSVAKAFADLATGQEDALGTLEAIGRAFLQMIASILQTVAMLIIQALILSAVDKMTGGILLPLLKVTAAAVSVKHDGGVMGEAGGRSRNVNPAIFAGAPQYHSGGIAGLAPNELPAILKKGEEVLTESDPRHRMNGGMNPQGGPSGMGIRQVLAIGDDEIAGAMSGGAGENTVMTHIRRNKATIKQMLEN